MACVLGLDIGSAYSKGLLAGEDLLPLATRLIPSGGSYRSTADLLREELLSAANRSPDEIDFTVATGYGAKSVGFADLVKSDVSCHSRGIHHLFPAVRTAVDVGDLYTKVFRLDERGNVLNFLLSGKCAGGSGRVLQIIARVLQLRLDQIGPLSLQSKHRIDFNTGCVVFAESEAVSRVAAGVSREDLLAGMHRALASQIESLVDRVKLEPELALVGGGARDVGLVQAVRDAMHTGLRVPPEPHFTAALGAVLIAAQEATGR